MKMHVVQCTACKFKCIRNLPVLTEPYAKARDLSGRACQTFAKEKGTTVQVRVLYKNLSIEANEKCFCGSGKKFKKCCMKLFV